MKQKQFKDLSIGDNVYFMRPSCDIENSTNMSLIEAKNNGNKIVILNGFKESINYVMSLTSVTWVGETKSDDGYSTVQCYLC